MKHMKHIVTHLSKMMHERRKQGIQEATQVTDNYMLLGSILGSYCGSLKLDKRNK